MFWTGCESALSGTVYPRDKYEYIATDEGPLAVLSTRYDLVALARSLPGTLLPPSAGMFRYIPFLPLAPDADFPSLVVGMTPLVPVRHHDRFKLWVKDEGRNPTGSLKDRSSALVCAKAKELGVRTITTASSGNAAAATSAMAANLGLECVIFVPEAAPTAKICQNRLFGARVYLVPGEYDDAVACCHEVAARKGWYNRSTAYNPFTVDGKKTVAFEICEQLADEPFSGKFVAPDVVVTPCGVGNILSGIHKGFQELYDAKLIDKVPRIIASQAEGSNSIYVCWRDGGDPREIKPMVPFTRADSLSTAMPNDAIRAMRAVTETGGAFVEVSDKEIFEALPRMARISGVFGEPAAATAWAGMEKAWDQGHIQADDRVVLVSTGNGLKDIPGALASLEGMNEPVRVTDASAI